ncbi:DUF4007 family protein [Psychroflexus sediminis]|uniref:DUF4007 domain-containing protein n=1 Tax=Psychroflexus sediminis TaxID=470826 RepID=A0A1G7VAN8_9FLAO|nr:DUF4007 family protein [Psychroflexus sediminis]SDG56020.1 Protein of unknown function [Psychroflexus sediminis]
MNFSGHDTFHCRLFWLKKGYDYVSNEQKFKDDSGVDLGVGRNMVNSIRFWLKSFGVIDDAYKVNGFYRHIFDDEGFDPYLENEATLWLLHYKLNELNHSTIYRILFGELRMQRPEFTRKNFVDYTRSLDPKQNKKTLEKDFSVFLRMYLENHKDLNDGYSGLLTELNLVREIGKTHSGEQLYRIENPSQEEIPDEIILYCILSNEDYGKSISFNSLYNNQNGVGKIFCLDKDILETKLIEISEKFKGVTYNSEAGVKELQFKSDVNAMDIIKNFYNA